MHGLLKAVWLLAPVTALARGPDPGRRDSTPVADLPEMPWKPVVPDAPVAPTSPDMPELPGAPNDDEPNALCSEIAELDFLYQRRAELEEVIAFQEQRLAEEYGWLPSGGESECHGFKCLVENIVEKVSDVALSLYEDIAGVEDIVDGPGHGRGKGPRCRHPKHPKHGRPGRKPHCPGKGPHHGWPHRGNHSHHGNHTHSNHTLPHPPPWRCPPHRLPHHPPPFCRCPPQPPRGGGPHHPPPDHPPPHRKPPPHRRPGDDDGGRRLAPENETDGPPPAHQHNHPPRRHHHLPLALKIAGASTLFVIAFSLHRRLHGKYASCVARREARRSRRHARSKQCVRRLLFRPWFPRRRNNAEEEEEEEKESMLPRHEEESSMEDELASCRVAADIVGDMVAAEEGRALLAAQQQRRDVAGHVEMSGVQFVDGEEVLPAYDERSDSSVADGLRYTPGSSTYTPSSSGSDELGDRKH